MKQPEIAKKFKRQPFHSSRTSPPAACIRTCAWPDGEPPVPKRAGGQHKPIPDYDPTDNGSWSWRPRSST